jgi:hypothetical protein
MMNQATILTIFRWIHIVFAIPIIGYIYSPFDQIPNYARPTRFVFVPVLALSGLWMWKGHVVRRLVSKRSEGDPGSYSNL